MRLPDPQESPRDTTFRRRLILLISTMSMVTVTLIVQLGRLAVAEAAEHRADAERALDARTYLPTYRGKILDRHGRILATDRAANDIALHFEFITGEWVTTRARAEARAEVGRSAWGILTAEQRQAKIDERFPKWHRTRQQLLKQVMTAGFLTESELLQHFDEICAKVQRMAAVVWQNQRAEMEREYGDDTVFTPRPILEQESAHVILSQVDDEVAFTFRRLSDDWPDVFEVRGAHERLYKWSKARVTLDRSTLPRPIRSERPVTILVEGVADHILGSVRDEVWEEDVARRPFVNPKTNTVDLGGYRTGDVVGSQGLESVFEDHLRGARGMVMQRRNTGTAVRTEPVPGADLHLSLDVMLQARIQAILTPEFGLCKVQDPQWHHNDKLPMGWPLNAAAVVIEVETGEILAMVSMPTKAMGIPMDEAKIVRDTPMINRPAEAIYPPGSIIKPLLLAAAVNENLHAVGSPIECTGHYYEHIQNVARCWIYREIYEWTNHGVLRADEALGRSCNVFFYTLADRLGIRRLIEGYRAFGLGQHLNIGLAHVGPNGNIVGESGGILPDDDTIRGLRERGELDAATIFLGIGQGPMAWTPLQAANAYAQLARGGDVRDATLVPDDPRGTCAASRADQKLDPALVDIALEGLRQAVSEYHGTGHHILYGVNDWEPIINAEGITAWAKTGTAQAPPLILSDSNGDGKINSKDDGRTGLDHAWFVGLVAPAGLNRPLHAIAVIVEYGGSGGRVAGPVANQIIHALQAEGYLPGGGA